MQRRLTKQKLAISKVLSRTGVHLTAAEVWQQVRSELKNISLATVYRNLEQLTQAGDLESVLVAGFPQWYELKKPACHGHLFCRQCQQLFEVVDCQLCMMKTALSRVNQFKEEQLRFVAIGLCKKCNKKNDPN